MAKREIIDISPVSHNAPIPMAVKIRDLVFSSAIMGADPETGELPKAAEEQARFVFQNLRAVMEQAGGDVDDIAHVNVFLKELSYKEIVNGEWLQMFPDERDRPARHSIQADLPGDLLIQLEIVAVL